MPAKKLATCFDSRSTHLPKKTLAFFEWMDTVSIPKQDAVLVVCTQVVKPQAFESKKLQDC